MKTNRGKRTSNALFFTVVSSFQQLGLESVKSYRRGSGDNIANTVNSIRMKRRLFKSGKKQTREDVNEMYTIRDVMLMTLLFIIALQHFVGCDRSTRRQRTSENYKDVFTRVLHEFEHVCHVPAIRLLLRCFAVRRLQ